MPVKISNTKTSDGNVSNEIENAKGKPATKSSTAKICKANSKWRLIKSGAGKGMSMPEYFINKPSEFMDEFYRADRGYFDLTPYTHPNRDIADQAMEIIYDLNRVQRPPRYKGKKTVSIVAVRDWQLEWSIAIVTSMERKWELLNSAGTVASAPINELFNSIVFIYVIGASQYALKHAVDYALSEITGENSGNWNRAKCEWFFDTGSHFVDDHRDYYDDDDDYDDE